MKLKQIFTAALVCSLSACAFFEEPLDDPGLAEPVAAPATSESLPLPPPLPSPSRNNQATAQTEGTYFIVSSIFEVPENIPSLSFVHFTDRSRRRESALCEALLNMHPIVRPADIPANAENLIIWPVTEGSAANNCKSMIDAHEPLEISSQTAAVVNSDGPYLMSRNSQQEKQMIYDFSDVSTGSLSTSLNEWQQLLGGGAQNWPPVVKAR